MGRSQQALGQQQTLNFPQCYLSYSEHIFLYTPGNYFIDLEAKVLRWWMTGNDNARKTSPQCGPVTAREEAAAKILLKYRRAQCCISLSLVLASGCIFAGNGWWSATVVAVPAPVLSLFS